MKMPPQRRGFSLVEVVIAIAILSFCLLILLALLPVGLTSTTDSLQKTAAAGIASQIAADVIDTPLANSSKPIPSSTRYGLVLDSTGVGSTNTFYLDDTGNPTGTGINAAITANAIYKATVVVAAPKSRLRPRGTSPITRTSPPSCASSSVGPRKGTKPRAPFPLITRVRMKPSPRLTGTSRTAVLSSGAGRGGFSLVELMVSMAILALMLSIIGVMIGIISQAIGDSRKLLNSDDQARLVFIRMASDFSRMLTRKDVDIIFAKQNGSTTSGSNDSIFFVTEGSGSNTNTSYFSSTSANILSLAGYCIAPDAQGTQISPTVASPLNDLNRLGHALTWDTANSSPDNLVFVSFAAPTQASTSSALITSTTLDGHWGSSSAHPVLGASPTYTPPTTSSNYGDYHAIGDQVFRFEYCFLLKDGSYSNVPVMTSVATQNLTTATVPPTPTNDSSGSYSPGSRWFDATDGRAFICVDATKNNAVWAPLGVQDVSAIIVAIALLDRDSRLRVTSAATFNNLPGFFADSLQTSTTTGTSLSKLPFSATSPVLMQQNWQATIDSPTFASTVGLNQGAAAHIRIYQRYFYLNANTL